jgi:3-hydroxybutyryl-CoA dehydrogenase
MLARSRLANSMPAFANVVISNVPGPNITLYFAGAKQISTYPVSIPYHGMALNITLQSYNGWLDFGLIGCHRVRIADIASALARPAPFAGLHFLKPGHLTAVVEVVPGPATDAAVVTGLEARAAAMGKAPLVVRADVPGFIWNRIQFAVLRECLHMLEAGVADAADIDAAVSDGLAPRWMAAGPLATADLGGLGVFATVSAQLFPHLADDREAPELARRAAEGQAFAPWTARGGEEVAALRARALELGREIAARRRELGA